MCVLVRCCYVGRCTASRRRRHIASHPARAYILRALLLRALLARLAWKKQWCILRPNPTEDNSGVLALHSAVGVLANSTIDLPTGSAVCRTKSRTHQYAFGVFLAGRYRKPHVLLAGQTESETQMWMSKIRALLNGTKHFGKNVQLKNSFEVSIIDNEFSRNCLLYGVHGTLTVSSHGVLISQPNVNQLKIFIAWKHFSDIILTGSQNVPDTNKICQLFTNSRFSGGAGHLSIFCALGAELVRAVKAAHAEAAVSVCRDSHKRISRSESDLYSWSQDSSVDDETAGIRRSSWYSGPSEVSLDDTDLIRTKDANIVPSGQLLRCAAEDDLYPISYSKQHLLSYVHKFSLAYADTPPDRRSCTSLASGIYEEILEDTDSHQAATKNHKCSSDDDTHVNMQAQTNEDSTDMDISLSLEENTYESVAECVYATMRRTGKRYAPPPLPPRSVRASSIAAKSTTKLTDSWNCRLMDTDVVDGAVMHHGGSLGSLPRCYTQPPLQQDDFTKTLPKFHKTKSFFRKRIKSESRMAPNTSRTDKVLGEAKKKKLDPASRTKDSVTPSKLEMIKNFSMSRALMKNLRISSPSLRKLGEARSCEYLDTDASATEIAEPRCSKSAESLGGLPTALEPLSSAAEDDGQDLSVMYAESAQQFSLPQDIVELILKGRDDLAELRLRRRQLSESDYIPMSPNGLLPSTASRTPCESHYTVMTSPASSMAAVASVAPDIVT